MQGHESVEADIRKLIEEHNPDIYIVDIKLKTSRRSVLSILLDTDEGITIDECARVSRRLNAYFEEEDPFSFPFELQVSSPGVGRPLVMRRQFRRHVGRKLKVRLTDDAEVKGRLQKVEEDVIVLELPPKKKKKGGKNAAKKNKEASPNGANDDNEITIGFDSIKEAKVEISFD